MPKDIPYSEYYKRKMQEEFKHQVPHIQPKFNPRPLQPHQTHYSKKPGESAINKIILAVLILLFLISFISLIIFLPKSNLSLIIIAVFGIILLFLILTLLHKLYEHTLVKTNPILIILIVYILLTVNMFLGAKIYSIEWAFLGFIIATVIVYDSKIDSRFLILPALLLLGYIPFLLIGKFNAIAENIAIYVYYFLVCGVVLQVIEHVKKITNRLNFDSFSKGMLREFDWIKTCILTGIFSIGVIIANRFYELPLLKWTSVYIFLISLIIYSLTMFKEEK
ncbi:hypothetical protein J4218_00180 [Candidatus Pacearchaeota archaeon]|nr:hypothetical protein [Candidatus Pacearchaeota archaeon]